MWYRCGDCGHAERIWNSRDGVTPFMMSCPSCGQPKLQHGEWESDECLPDHTLRIGQRFWRDGTSDEAVAAMKRRIEILKDEYPTTAEDQEELIEAARSGKDEFKPGWPYLDITGRGD